MVKQTYQAKKVSKQKRNVMTCNGKLRKKLYKFIVILFRKFLPSRAHFFQIRKKVNILKDLETFCLKDVTKD